MLLSVGVAVANLLLNTTFNRGLYEPEGWSLNQSARNRVEWLCDREDENQGGLKLTGCGEDWAGASSERVTVTPGEALTVAAWLQPEGALPDRDHLYVRFFSRGAFRGQTGPDIPTRGAMWTLCAGSVIVPEDCDSADVSLQIRSRGTVLLGAVGLYRGDLVARAGELLPKPPPLKPVPMKTPKGLPPDRNNNGLADRLEEFLAVPKGASSVRRKRRNTTCFQTPTGYRPDNDLKVGSVLVVNESREAIQSWQQMGYHSYYMTGFRAGPDYVDQHPGSVQQTRSGHLLDCGPGSYYMVPTEDRRKILRERFRLAFENGAEGAAPEEPEFIGSGGYSPAFQKEYQAFYGRPWVPPHTSPQARVDCQRLMGHLQVELLRACYDGAHSVKPKAPSFLLCHSPLNYASWGITFPHYETISKLKADSANSGVRRVRIDQMIAQVWTGTARTPINHQGVRKERTFENAYLEYSSSLNLVRGKGIPTWLLMDPVEDNPDLPMEDYFHNYKRTLGAALMFPETDLYEVMPWPTRIFGRVPPQFATVVCTIVNALADMQNHRQVVHDRGTPGLASFLSDSAMWQRHEPSPADFDALYGLTLPLLMKGIPVELAHLDRVGEKGYLNPYRVLLVSFDALKPIAKANVDGLVAWVKAGGHLLVFGGDDPYNDLNLWWKDQGCRSPYEYLLKSLGLKPAGRPDSIPDGEGVSETRVGKGSVLVCGLPPSYFTKSPAADQLLRSLVRRVCEQRAGLPYREQGRLGIQRGPYVVVKTFDEPASVEGPAIDLMSPDLAVRPAGNVGPDDLVILRRLPRQKGEAPLVAASSMCVEWSCTSGRELKLIASGPSGVTGVMRLVTGGKRISVTARDAYGKEQPVRVEPEGDTALLHFDSQPQGLAMRIRTE